jgi:hypothetical protein
VLLLELAGGKIKEFVIEPDNGLGAAPVGIERVGANLPGQHVDAVGGEGAGVMRLFQALQILLMQRNDLVHVAPPKR